jgi:hypothetical protein
MNRIPSQRIFLASPAVTITIVACGGYLVGCAAALQWATDSLDKNLKFLASYDDGSFVEVCCGGYWHRLDLVGAMYKFHLKVIILGAIFAAVNHLGAQSSKASIKIGSAAVARAYASYDRGPVAASMVLHNMSVILQPGDARRVDLEQFVASQQDPTSQSYHRWLTPEQYAERFGVPDATVARVAAWLQSQGMTNVRAARGRMFVSFSGSADSVASAFQTEIHAFDVRGVRHFANVVQPSVPAELRDSVANVMGLHDFTPEPQLARSPQPAAAGLSSGLNLLGPGDLATIYGMNSLYSRGITGKGVTVAVLGQTPIGLTDYQAYRKLFGLPANDFQTLQAPGSTTGTNNPADAEEATLDVEIIGGVAPDATVLYVWGSSVNWALQWAIDDAKAQVISESYAGCEGPGADFYQTLALQANAEGITLVSSAGDSGAAGCDLMGSSAASGGYFAEVPASAPSVTAVGGTAFANGNPGQYWGTSSQPGGATALSYIPETGWSSAQAVFGGGGGLSSMFGKPGYQSDFYTSNTSQRMVPDVSFAASPVSSPYAIILNGSEIVIGGTSAATPLFGGIVALVNNYLVSNGSMSAPGLGNINPTLYRLNETAPSAFHDVATGSNDVPCKAGSPNCSGGIIGYPAQASYDLATGLGSVDAYVLASNWTSAPLTPTTAKLSVSAAEIEAEQILTMTVTVESAAGPVAGSPVQFYFTDPTNNNQPNPTLLATVPTDNAGAATYITNILPLGVSTIKAIASGSTTASPAPPVSTTVVVDGLPSTTAVQAATGPYQIGQKATINVQVSVPTGQRLYGPDKNVKYYYSGQGISLYTSDGVLVSGPVVPDETGAATIVSNALAAGNNTFYAVYSGNNYVLPSQSSTVTLLAGSSSSTIATTTTLSASSTEVQTIPFSVTLTAHVVQASGTAIPDGTVTIYAQGVPINTASIDSTGSARFDYTLASEGVNAITATYNGSGNFAASTSAPVNITVGTASATSDFRIEGPSSITVSGSANTAISLQIIPVNGFNQTIQLSCSGLPAGESCSLPANVTPSSAMAIMLTIASTSTVTLAGMPGCLLLLFLARRKRKLIVAFMLIAATVLISGCVGKSTIVNSPAAPSQTYPVTIMATSGSITHQFVVNVTLNR